MSQRYSTESLRSHINLGLSAYAREAAGLQKRGHNPAIKRALKCSSLAAVVPLAAVGSAVAQCLGAYPAQSATLTVTSGSDVIVPMGTGTSPPAVTFGYNLGATYYTLIADASGAPLLADAGLFLTAARLTYSDVAPVTPGAGQLFVSANALVCFHVDPSAALNGLFCNPPTTGHLAVNVGGSSGFIELEIVDMGNGSGAQIKINQRYVNPVAGVPSPISACGASLPVEIVSFDGVTTGSSVVLGWETASELNNAGFEIQRAHPGETFRRIGFVTGEGTTAEAHSYRFADETIEPNVHYRYRLKQIDFDGTTSFSEIVEVFTEDPSGISLSEFYPNPAVNGRATLKINVADQVEAAIELYDARGALVHTKRELLNAGQNQLRFRADDLATGSHFAKVQIGERVLYRQFVVGR